MTAGSAPPGERLFALTRSGELGPADGSGTPPGRPPRLLVADSWLVEDGQARALDRHRHRFTASCLAETDLSPALLETFWEAVVPRLPREPGPWFPRVELVPADPSAGPARLVHGGGYRLQLRLRAAPPRGTTVRVLGEGTVDPRRTPHHKGPDLDRLAEVRRKATAAGADEALLVTPDGLLVEAANSSLLWWEGDTLCQPAADLPTLPGVTAALLCRRAAERGVDVRPRHARPADLAGREVWLANALHGLRPVVAWVGTDLLAGGADRAPAWRRWWWEQAVPLPS